MFNKKKINLGEYKKDGKTFDNHKINQLCTPKGIIRLEILRYDGKPKAFNGNGKWKGKVNYNVNMKTTTISIIL